MARATPEQAAARWQQRLSASTEAITQGVNNVTEAPGRKAAAARQAWLTNVQASADKWARNVSRVTLDDWRRKMLEVGVPRVAQGAQANIDKVQSFMADFLPYLDRGVAEVKSMPNVTLEDKINRAVAMMRHNARFKRAGGSTGGV